MNPLLIPYIQAVQASVPDAKLSPQEVILILQAICGFGEIFETDICPIINDLVPECP